MSANLLVRPRSRANKMADFGSALEMVNKLIAKLERLMDGSDIGVVVLQLDFLHRMLVSLDVEDDVVDMIGTLNENFSVLERSSSHANVTEGYRPLCTSLGERGRPSFQIPKEQLSFLLELGFKVQEVSSILGVGKHTIERRMAAFGLCVSGEYEKWIMKDIEDSNASDRGEGGGAVSSLPFFFPFQILLVLGKVVEFFGQYFQMPVMFYDSVKDSFGLFINYHLRKLKFKRLFCFVL